MDVYEHNDATSGQGPHVHGGIVPVLCKGNSARVSEKDADEFNEFARRTRWIQSSTILSLRSRH